MMTECVEETRSMSSSKRQKERKIREVLQGVALWRYYYNGFLSPDGQYHKLSLDEAAEMLDFNKKTLDDYILQIRYRLIMSNRKATFYGFDFGQHLEEKMGVLRKFNQWMGREESGCKLKFKDIPVDLDQYLPDTLPLIN